MDKDEALEVLRRHLALYRQRTYSDLVGLIGKPSVAEVTGPSGARYQIEVEAYWDSKRNGDLRVMGSVDDGGLRAFMPLTDDFILSPEGRFLGE